MNNRFSPETNYNDQLTDEEKKQLQGYFGMATNEWPVGMVDNCRQSLEGLAFSGDLMADWIAYWIVNNRNEQASPNPDRAQLEALHQQAQLIQPEPVPLMAAFQALSEFCVEYDATYTIDNHRKDYSVFLLWPRPSGLSSQALCAADTLPDAIWGALEQAKGGPSNG